MNDYSAYYESTMKRIVEGFRFSKEIDPGIYRFYYDWAKNRENKTEHMKNYIKFYESDLHKLTHKKGAA